MKKLIIKNKVYNGTTLIELLIYFALLSLVMTFIALILRQMFWHDNVKETISDYSNLKNVLDKVTNSLRNSFEIIKPKPNELTSKIIILKNDGTYEKIGMYEIGNQLKFVFKSSNQFLDLDPYVDYANVNEVHSNDIKEFYVMRPLYNHIVIKIKTFKNEIITSITLDSLRMPTNVLIQKDYFREFKDAIININSGVKITDKINLMYKNEHENLLKALINKSTINNFFKEFDNKSKSKNLNYSKTLLKKFINENEVTDIGKIIFLTTYLIERISNEINLATNSNKIEVKDKHVKQNAIDIFGLDIISSYEQIVKLLSYNVKRKFVLKPNYKALIYEIEKICEHNKKTLITSSYLTMSLSETILDERGNPINIVNLYHGKTIPLSLNDVNVLSNIEALPYVDSLDCTFESIYEIIDAKLPYLSLNNTFAQNFEILMYGFKKIKQVHQYSNKIDILDYKIKIPVDVIINNVNIGFDLFLRQAYELAILELPDLTKNIPLPLKAK